MSTRTATSPGKGGSRDTLVGMIPAAVTAYVFTHTGSPELSTGAGALVAGALTFLRKKLQDYRAG